MKDIQKFIILGLLFGALVSCQSIKGRNLSSAQIEPEKVTYRMLQNEVNNLLEKTQDLKKFTVVLPEVL